MAVVRFLDRVQDDIQAILERRAAPDDDLEWGVTLTPTLMGCEEHEHEDIALILYLTLACPESGTRSTTQVMVPADDCSTEALDVWVNDIWDRIVVARMNSSMERA